MSYEIMNKQTKASNGQVVSTKVDIKQNDPYTIISRDIDGDHSVTTDKKVIELVLDQINEETTPKSELKGQIKSLQSEISNALESIKSQKNDAEMLFGTVDELISVIYEEVIPRVNKQDEETNDLVEPEKEDGIESEVAE